MTIPGGTTSKKKSKLINYQEWEHITASSVVMLIKINKLKYSSLNHIKINIMKTRKHFIRKYELLARCIQTNLELFILQ